MKYRCGNPRFKSYKNITFCKTWETFQGFYEDMGERPEGTTLDRIDPRGNYSKDNCRWATPETQQNNRTNNRYYNVDGQALTLPQIARKYGINISTLKNKIYRDHLDMCDALRFFADKNVALLRQN